MVMKRTCSAGSFLKVPVMAARSRKARGDDDEKKSKKKSSRSKAG